MKKFSDLKPFTKEWFTNYWFYFKWHTIAVLFVLILVVSTIVEVVNRENPDYQIGLVAAFPFAEEFKGELKEKLEISIDDINNDDKKIVQFLDVTTSAAPQDEMQMAASQKLFLEFSAGDTFIYIMDKELYQMYDEQDIFQKIKGEETAIPVSEIDFFKDMDVYNSDNLVLCMRHLRQKEKISVDNAHKLLDIILSAY